MYEQSLVKVIKDYIKPNIIKKNNRYKKWEYGYDVENDIIIISKDGTIGDIIEIQNLRIALPLLPENIYSSSKKTEEQVWVKEEYPKALSKIKSVFEWNKYPELTLKSRWYEYIDDRV